MKLKLLFSVLAIALLAACAKKASTPDQALVNAQEVYSAMAVRYEKVLKTAPMSPECMQELRVLGVHRERTWGEFFYDLFCMNWFAGNTRTSTPIYRMEAILGNDLGETGHALKGLRNFNLEHRLIYKELAELHNKIVYIREQLPTQKDYVDENNTRITHAMLTTITAQTLKINNHY